MSNFVSITLICEIRAQNLSTTARTAYALKLRRNRRAQHQNENIRTLQQFVNYLDLCELLSSCNILIQQAAFVVPVVSLFRVRSWMQNMKHFLYWIWASGIAVSHCTPFLAFFWVVLRGTSTLTNLVKILTLQLAICSAAYTRHTLTSFVLKQKGRKFSL
jgi:hypothetical protein